MGYSNESIIAISFKHLEEFWKHVVNNEKLKIIKTNVDFYWFDNFDYDGFLYKYLYL